MRNLPLYIPEDAIRESCEEHHIRHLALFGSVLREDFTPDSDIDVLIEFESRHCVELITFAGMENELSGILGRKVDLNTPGGPSPYFRNEVLKEAETLYVTA